jgi:hypothetical protein
VLYFADAKWWNWHKDKPGFQAFGGQLCSIENTGAMVEDPAVHLLHNAGSGEEVGGSPLSLDRQAITTGRNSGYQAMNIAALAGAATIILLGYDAGQPAGAPSHWFGEHPDPVIPSVYAVYRESFKRGAPYFAKAGIRVINASPGSTLACFDKMDLGDALASL